MKKLIIALFILTLAAAAFGVAQAQDERTALTTGFYVGMMPGGSVMYHIPSTTFDGQVFYVVRDFSGCTVFIYYRGTVGGWYYYDDFVMPVGNTLTEGNIRPNLYCNPSGTLDAYSNYKIRVYSVHIPTVKTSHQPYLPQLTPYP